MGGEQRGLPDLPFLHFAITQHHEDMEVAPGHAPAHGHAASARQRVADRARTEIDTGYLGHVGMVTERTAQAGVAVQVRLADEAPLRQDRKLPYRSVTLAHEEAVAVWPGRLARAQGHDVVVQRGKDLGGGEDRGVVADLGDLDQPDRLQTNELRLLAQAGHLLGGGCEIRDVRSADRTGLRHGCVPFNERVMHHIFSNQTVCEGGT
ncbi:hypothetical protein FQZ97_800810 [compost metagenome]